MVLAKMQQRLQKVAQWIAATKSILYVFSKETSTSQNVVGSLATCCLAGTGNTTNPVLAVNGTEHEAMSTHIAAALILAMMTIALYLVL